jgi:hypothetical protein
MLLMLAGDVESNPGPSYRDMLAGETSAPWDELTDTQARTYLKTMTDTVASIQKLPTQEWHGAMNQMRDLVKEIESQLPPLPAYRLEALANTYTQIGLDPVYKKFQNQYLVRVLPSLPSAFHYGQNREISYLQSYGDGNCLFNALSILLTGSDKYHLQIRLRVWVHSFTTCYETDGGNIPVTDAYLEETRKALPPGGYSCSARLAAAANLWQLQICHFLPVEKDSLWESHCFLPNEGSTAYDPSKPTIILGGCLCSEKTGLAPRSGNMNHFIPIFPHTDTARNKFIEAAQFKALAPYKLGPANFTPSYRYPEIQGIVHIDTMPAASPPTPILPTNHPAIQPSIQPPNHPANHLSIQPTPNFQSLQAPLVTSHPAIHPANQPSNSRPLQAPPATIHQARTREGQPTIQTSVHSNNHPTNQL